MNWFILALLAPAIYTVVNFIDKYIVEKKVKDYRGMPIYGSIVALIFGTAVWLLTGMPLLSLRDGLIVITTGILSMYGFALYFNALSKSQTSYIIALFQMMPILSLILSFLVLGEMISLQQLLGFVAVLGSVIALSINKESKGFKIDSAFYLILLADAFFALSGVLIKFTLNANSFSKILSYESWGLFLGGLSLYLLLPNVRRAFWESFNTVGKKILVVMFINEAIFVVSKSLTFLAISLGPVALVSVLGGTQVFYGLAYGWILTLIAPSIFNEDISKEGLVKKIVLTITLFIGLWLVSK
jgi:drug/metabolite transporter (DMT)-like permease